MHSSLWVAAGIPRYPAFLVGILDLYSGMVHAVGMQEGADVVLDAKDVVFSGIPVHHHVGGENVMRAVQRPDVRVVRAEYVLE